MVASAPYLSVRVNKLRDEKVMTNGTERRAAELEWRQKSG